jgi:hypothetical protein
MIHSLASSFTVLPWCSSFGSDSDIRPFGTDSAELIYMINRTDSYVQTHKQISTVQLAGN